MESATYEPGVPRSGAASAPGPFRAGDPPRCPRGRDGGLPARGCRMDGDAGSSPGPGAQDSAVERPDRIRDRRTRSSPQRRRLGARPVPRRRPSAISPGARWRRAAKVLRVDGDAGSPPGPGAQDSAVERPDRIRDRRTRCSPQRRRLGDRLVPRRRLRARSPRAPAAGCRRSVSGGRGRRFAGRTRGAGFGGRASGPNPRPTAPSFAASGFDSFRGGAGLPAEGVAGSGRGLRRPTRCAGGGGAPPWNPRPPRPLFPALRPESGSGAGTPLVPRGRIRARSPGARRRPAAGVSGPGGRGRRAAGRTRRVGFGGGAPPWNPLPSPPCPSAGPADSRRAFAGRPSSSRFPSCS